jgi:hypothetical protein
VCKNQIGAFTTLVNVTAAGAVDRNVTEFPDSTLLNELFLVVHSCSGLSFSPCLFCATKIEWETLIWPS